MKFVKWRENLRAEAVSVPLMLLSCMGTNLCSSCPTSNSGRCYEAAEQDPSAWPQLPTRETQKKLFPPDLNLAQYQ